MDLDDQTNSNFLASALDMLTCGLGATALLFILFSVVHTEPDTAAGAGEFLNVRFEVSDADKAVLLTPVLQPPNLEAIDVPIRYFDQITGLLSFSSADQVAHETDITALRESAQTEKGGGYSMLGFALSKDQAANVDGAREFTLHISRPIAGLWKVRARFFSIADGSIGRRSDPPIHVKTKLTTRELHSENESAIHFAQQTTELSVYIKP